MFRTLDQPISVLLQAVIAEGYQGVFPVVPQEPLAMSANLPEPEDV